MTDQSLDRLVRQVLTERAEAVAGAASAADSIAEDLASRIRPTAYGRTWVLLAALLLLGLLIGGTLALGAVRLPWLPTPGPAVLEWSGPLRPDSNSFPSVVMGPRNDDSYVWTDGADASAWVDIGLVRSGGFQLRWVFDIGEKPPAPAALMSDERTVEYGLVFDVDDDGVADCRLGINNDTLESGSWRVWVMNLTNGAIRTDPGATFEYNNPDDPFPSTPGMTFAFNGGARPCELYSPSARFYAYASMTEAGRVIAWDYAPDAGWLATPPEPSNQP